MPIVVESVKSNVAYVSYCKCYTNNTNNTNDNKVCNRHYKIIIKNIKCCCGSYYYGKYRMDYLYCLYDKNLYVYSGFNKSCHSKCHDPAIIEACNRYIIDKQWIVYCKLWYLIDVHITHDIARHITLLRLQDKIIKSYRF
jgi:hypothetical protein